MKYYRLIFTKKDSETVFSEIFEQEMENETFLKMNWEKPIIRHNDGVYLHFLALEKSYLEAIILGYKIAHEF